MRAKKKETFKYIEGKQISLKSIKVKLSQRTLKIAN